MLIKGLCDLYDELEKEEKLIKEGYSAIDIKYLICLSEDGELRDIISCQKSEIVVKGNKEQTVLKPISMVFPEREEYSGVKSNIVEHRAEYIFGLEYDKTNDKYKVRTDKHNAFVDTNLNFMQDIDSKIGLAYKKFINRWNPKNEVDNCILLKIKKDYSTSKFAFCLSGKPEVLLNEDSEVLDKWGKSKLIKSEEIVEGICSIYGKKAKLARIHRKISGIKGGQSTGTVLVGYNNQSECSYYNEQSFNSSISEVAMNKYTKALNYLTKNNNVVIDDVTILYWAIGCGKDSEEVIYNLIFGKKNNNVSNNEITEIISESLENVKEGSFSKEKYEKMYNINFGGDYYIVGIKPNVSRLSIKFVYKNKFSFVFKNAIMHQSDIKIFNENKRPVYLYEIRKELISPKSTKESFNPILMSRLVDSIIKGYKYPIELLENVVRRIKIDNDEPEIKKTDIKINDIRVGLIKAYINRKNRFESKKEEITMSLNEENLNSAYLCGRLFAVLQKIQEESVSTKGGKLNKTIKDSYFSKAVSRPVLVIPRLIEKAQYHLNNLENEGRKVNFNKLIGSIVSNLNNEFPKYLSLEDQGRFIIGYYQQYQKFFEKNNKEVIQEEE